ncbi:hypothetical protein [Aliivibrio fischeri]|uniref:hypothetical protein n=1 Tax=Aliivibrio fischeri TaxID=668 RepID=UPI0012DA65EA|nr:hypothetical protein [Aliivibrio fischeri]MUK68424.1 hypothetical protein [Aliivibrio fischeri]MUK73712.1 hypothetical protein [Aliivibrio fischeri]
MEVLIFFCLFYEWIVTGWFVVNKDCHFGMLLQHLKEKIYPQVKNIRVVSYFFVSVICVGGAGIWMPWFREDVSVYLPGNTIFTFVFALLGTLICNRLYFQYSSIRNVKKFYESQSDEKGKVDKKRIESYFEVLDYQSIISSWGLFIGCIVLIIVTYAYAKNYTIDSISGWIGLILALTLYFIALAEDISRESSPIESSKGDEEAGEVFNNSSEETLNESFFGD